MNREKITLLFLVIMVVILNYSFIDSFLIKSFDNSEYGIVERVIDGDTLVINGTSVRLLGINSPEKGEKYSLESTKFLEEKVLGKEVKLVFGKEKYDLYKRKLAYVFIGSQNVNLESDKNGHSNFYFPSGKDVNSEIFKKAWNSCLEKKINLCEMSKDFCSSCIELKELNQKEDKFILYNKCAFGCSLTNWEIKDEGRKKFIFGNFTLKSFKEVEIKTGEGNNGESLFFWKGEKYVWTKSGDTLFLRDPLKKLILWKNY